ncbi:MAG: glycosyltransferase [Aurantimonas endophytica]|uniref:glycosyltransferase n=1 Tax=Aurantimonas endophytica TaxID=1522175 RepID=UPI0030015133
MKICVVMPRYAIAGVPLAQMRFARALADRGHAVDLLVGRIDPDHPMPDVPGVNVIRLRTPNVRAMLMPLWRYFRNARPEVVFSAEDHLTCAVLVAAIASGSKAKISGSSRVTPFDTYSSATFSKRWLLKQLMRAVMGRAEALTCVSEDMVGQYREVFDRPRHICVYNIVDDRHSRRRMQEAVDDEWLIDRTRPLVVAAGRLAHWKGFDDLIRAMKHVAPDRQVRLLILGDGELRGELGALVR